MSESAKRKRSSSKLNPSEARAGYDSVFEMIYRLVSRIPNGRVMTYGQIARLLDDRYSPRLVGWAMHATPHDDRSIPWHRVINSRGGISTGKVNLHEPDLQRWMLEEEGVVFDGRGRCDLSLYQWSPVLTDPSTSKKVRAVRASIETNESAKKRKQRHQGKAKNRAQRDRTNGNIKRTRS